VAGPGLSSIRYLARQASKFGRSGSTRSPSAVVGADKQPVRRLAERLATPVRQILRICPGGNAREPRDSAIDLSPRAVRRRAGHGSESQGGLRWPVATHPTLVSEQLLGLRILPVANSGRSSQPMKRMLLVAWTVAPRCSLLLHRYGLGWPSVMRIDGWHRRPRGLLAQIYHGCETAA
jgi:hypothetical protein